MAPKLSGQLPDGERIAIVAIAPTEIEVMMLTISGSVATSTECYIAMAGSEITY